MALNEPSTRPLLEATAGQGYQMALNVACFGSMPGTNPPPPRLGKNWGFVWAEGRDEGGIEAGLVVDLASGPRSCLGKERKKEKEGKNAGRIPCERFSTAATNRRAAVNKKLKERKGGEICISLCS